MPSAYLAGGLISKAQVSVLKFWGAAFTSLERLAFPTIRPANVVLIVFLRP